MIRSLSALGVALIAAGACSAPAGTASAPAPAPLRLERPPFWRPDSPVRLPSKLREPIESIGRASPAEPRWLAHVEPGAKLELWPGAPEVRSCALADVAVLELEGDRIAIGVQSDFLYSPTVTRKALSLATVGRALVHSDAGVAFARLEPGTVVEPIAGSRPGLQNVCIDPPTCGVKGLVRSSMLGKMHRREDVAEPAESPGESITLAAGKTISLFDRQRRLLARFIPEQNAVALSRLEDHTEVLLWLSLWDRPGSRMLQLHGYVPTSTLELVGELAPSGSGIGSSGTGTAAPRVHIPRETWIHGRPDAGSRFAVLDIERIALDIREDVHAPAGWTAVWVDTPWARLPAFVETARVLAHPPNEAMQVVYGPDRSPLACEHHPNG